jgi:hypothetical protein
VKDLQTSPESSRFQMQLAQPEALAQFIANEEGLTIETATDRLQVGRDLQRGQFGQRLPARTNPIR